MSQEFIKFHRPNSANKPDTATKKVVRRQSTVRRRSVRKPNSDEMAQLAATEYSNNSEKLLHQVFEEFDQKLSHTKQEIHKDLFDSIYDNTFEYFNFYNNKRILCASGVRGTQGQSGGMLLNPICNVIPTIALYTGINSQDYAYLCDKLSDELQKTWTNNLFYINEKNASNIKTLVNSLYAQWDVDDKETLIKRNLFTLKYLFEYIRDQNDQDENNSSYISSKSVIFIFKQFELIPKEIIECFVSLVSCHVESLPIYFIIELASQSNVIYEQLSSGIISKLCIKKLYLMSPDQYVEKFLNRLFIESSTLFRLSGDVLNYLLEVYYDYNYSISNLVLALKYCFFDHLQTNELNAYFLCREQENVELHQSLRANFVENNTTNQELLKTVMKSSSTLANSNDEFMTESECLERAQTEWLRYNNQFVIICRFLYEMIKHLPCASEDNNNSGFNVFNPQNSRNFIDFYAKICDLNRSKSKKFCEMEQFVDLKRLFTMLSSAKTTGEIVASFNQIIESKVANDEASYEAEFLIYLHDFKEILSKITTIANSNNTTVEPPVCDESVLGEEISQTAEITSEMVAKKRLGGATSLARRSSTRTMLKTIQESEIQVASPTAPAISKLQRRNTLSVASQKPQLKMQQLEQAKAEMFTWLSQQFSIYFDTELTSSLPTGRFFSYNKSNLIRKRLHDVQRLNVHDCLLNSFSYVKRNGFLDNEVKDETSISPKVRRSSRKSSPTSMNTTDEPDLNDHLSSLNVIYRLYLEANHMINLYDWLQAFVENQVHADLKELSESKRKLFQALFFRSITELQFMGFIKPTSRKVDHVVKLTSGSSNLIV